MKTTVKIALMMFLAVLSGACQNTEPGQIPQKELVYTEFNAVRSEQTKTSLSGSSVLWDVEGETISIIASDGTAYPLSQTSVSQDRKTATFGGQVPADGLEYAVYPSDAFAGYSSGLVSVSIPSQQNATDGSFADGASACIAKVDQGQALHFRNAGGLLGFTVNNSGITSIRLTATEKDGGSLTGPVLVDYSGDAPYCLSEGNASGASVELTGNIQSGTTYWAVVAPGTYSNLSLVFSDGSRTATFTKAGPIEITRNKQLRISAFTIDKWDGEEQTQVATLTYSEASDKVSGYNTSSEYQNSYGTWEIRAYNTNSSMQLNSGKQTSWIGTPEFSGTIKSITINNVGTATDATLYACLTPGGTSSVPTPNTSVAVKGKGTYSMDVSQLEAKRLYLRSNKVVQITSVTVEWSGSGTVVPPQPQNPAVTTLEATGIGMADATLHASFTNLPLSPDPVAAFFRWGTSSGSLDRTAYDNNVILNTASGSFSASLTGLQEYTTYYYQAVVTLANGTDVEGAILSFTTRKAQQVNSDGYLSCYEIPATEISGSMTSGSEKFGYKWYKFLTPDPKRAVAVHTVKYNDKVIRNYTVMMDADKKSPVWCATAFNSGTWPDNNIGRKGSWTSDPAFPVDWQQENATGSYSKGHFIASNYRQTTLEANKQTFYLSNQAAQWQQSFNDGIWNQLENAVTNNLSGRDTLYVVVGILFEGNTSIQSGVYIPSHFYKCLMKCSFDQYGTMTTATGCAYLFENRAYSNGAYSNYKTTIDAIEQRSGLDFFHNVPDDLEEPAESKAGSPI